jgi:hypothetical protein
MTRINASTTPPDWRTLERQPQPHPEQHHYQGPISSTDTANQPTWADYQRYRQTNPFNDTNTQDQRILQESNEAALQMATSDRQLEEDRHITLQTRLAHAKNNMKTQLTRQTEQHRTNKFSLKGNNPLDTAQCFYNIETAGKGNYDGMFDQAHDRSHETLQTIIDDTYTGFGTRTKATWTELKALYIQLTYHGNYLPRFRDAFAKAHRTQGDDNCIRYIEREDRVLRSVLAAYTDGNKSENDKDSIKQTFVTSWIRGLTRNQATLNLAVTYEDSIRSPLPRTWEQIQLTAQAAEETVKTLGSHHGTSEAKIRAEQKEIERKIKRQMDKATHADRDRAARRRTEVQQDQESYNKRQRQYKQSFDDHKLAMAASLNQLNERTRTTQEADATLQASLNTAAAQMSMNRPPPAGPNNRYNNQRNSPRNHGPPQGKPPPRNNETASRSLARIQSGLCFQCGNEGHLQSSCGQTCPYCRAKPQKTPNHHYTCKLHPRNLERNIVTTTEPSTKPTHDTLGNGKAR